MSILLLKQLTLLRNFVLGDVHFFPGSSVSEESACNAGDLGSVPVWGRSSGEGTGNPLWCSCLENSMDRGTWYATIHDVTKSRI